ncbi:MAG: hydrogenase nickel incorporation protein HypB [Chloroflexi bacterium]|nr:hydrogenase nickel incorporation protein HypB [Chloroflexota bacterium]
MKINVMTDVLEANDRIAAENMEVFKKHRNLVLNLISSPGTGKTTMLEKTAEMLKGKLRLGVIAGDVETARDSERLQKYKLQVVQLTTGGACHLDANMITYALPHIDLKKIDILVIENVGNLVCPAGFKVGEDYKVVMLSVTEGDEKPLKYPLVFNESALLLINKIDLLKYTNFNLKEAKANARRVNPDLDIIDISCTTGEGIADWISWLNQRYQKKFGTKARA